MAHKSFVSYHHGNDQSRADHIRKTYGENNTLIDHSLPAEIDSDNGDYILGQIRTKHLKDSTVTIVLIGSETSKRKWVDWEIYSSLRPYGDRKVNGLLGIYLPTSGDVPARLQDNIDSGYAVTMKWENISWQLKSKIDEAYDNRSNTHLINNSRARQKRNL
ncbi:TIR domain-containing protein [Bacillus mycoides]|uniref:TIR domain-containing protein n=1 Tax=Bacillus mycoides TaxID=1405 RepID=UPI003CF38426